MLKVPVGGAVVLSGRELDTMMGGIFSLGFSPSQGSEQTIGLAFASQHATVQLEAAATKCVSSDP